MKNVRGVFPVEVLGKVRDTKATFGVVEKLERQVFQAPITEKLTHALSGKIYFTDIIDVLYQGLLANGDTRINRDEIAEYVMHKGMDKYFEWYFSFLGYCIGGDKDSEAQEIDDKKK